MRAAAFVLLALAAPAVFSQTAGAVADHVRDAVASPTEIIAHCGQVDAEDAVGLQELEAFCPGIEHALVESGYAPFISEEQLDGLTTYSFIDLQQLAQRYGSGESAPRGRDLDVTKLDSILDTLTQPAQVELAPGWFERFKRWLRQAFAQQQSDPGSWVNRWLPDLTISQALSKTIGYVLMVLVIVFAIGVLVNELRAAGLLKRGGGSRRVPARDFDAASHVTAAAEDELDAAPLRDRPSVLLRMLVTTLLKTGRLRTERSLTHRELASRASLDGQSQRECFQRIAAAGEHAVYGGDNLPVEEIEKVVEAGRSLNAQLLASARTA